MAPPTKARPRVAYDLGRRGETLPDDWHDDPELSGAYEMGVDDRDAAVAESPRRHGAPTGPRRTPVRHAKPRTSKPAGDATPDAGDTGSDGDTGSSRTSWRPAVNLSPRGGGGGLVLGIVGYCIGRAFLTEGPHGIWRWYSAKFMNKPLARRAGDVPSAPAHPSAAAPASRRVVST